MQWLKSLIFVIYIYLFMAVWGIICFPLLLLPKGARWVCGVYASHVIWLAQVMLGIRSEVRGEIPTGEVVIAAKHQSFLDIMIIYNAVPAAKFIMKRELIYTPFIGQYAWRLGCVPVNRGKRGQAISKMLEDVKKGSAQPGQLVIYSQGTRVAPGDYKPYKIGTAAIYRETGWPCVPAATNVGLLWPRKGILRKPGLAVVEFLDPIPPGVDKAAFMSQLETTVEAKSNELMKELGFDAESHLAARAKQSV
ncbi:lysophospholipid acyltransferase family protein [uncultured Pelagimonas sp.]|uniref:lysophospholipid acyltransferase family protein n=1 Tax=uncultured Pelagimonas sp. TaxID=1618102 RepID=UPI0026116229|nr:lysophospholipid acyltransferase family protein [uncultured Pelagimonas sp.]